MARAKGKLNTPSAHLEMQVIVPSHVFVNENIQIKTSVKMDPERSTVESMPLVELKEVIATMEGSTEICAKWGIIEEWLDDSVMEVVSTAQLVDLGLFDAKSNFEKEVLFFMCPSDKVRPSFRAFNISRRYHLKVRAVFSCAGTDVAMDRSWPILVLPTRQEQQR